MPTVMAYHDIKDKDRWLASPRRDEFFGPLGVTNIRTFVDPENPTRGRFGDGRSRHDGPHGWPSAGPSQKETTFASNARGLSPVAGSLHRSAAPGMIQKMAKLSRP
jgi:hypothetical protein